MFVDTKLQPLIIHNGQSFPKNEAKCESGEELGSGACAVYLFAFSKLSDQIKIFRKNKL